MESKFTFKNKIEKYSLTDTFDPNSGQEILTLYCSHLPKPDYAKYNFDSLTGLVTSNVDSKKNNPFGEFLSINKSTFIDYLNKYGFLFDWESSENYDSIEFNYILEFQSRLKLLLSIFNNIAKSIEYKELLLSTFLLIGKPQLELNLGKSKFIFPSLFPFHVLRNSIPEKNLSDMTTRHTSSNGKITTYIKVENKFSENGYTCDLDFLYYQDIIENLQYDDFIKDIFYLYVNKPANLEPITAHIIDFIYLFFSKVGICDISNTNLKFEDEDLSNFMKSSELKNALLILSKEILALEINRGLAKVQPKINLDTLLPDWNLPDLISAFYFTLFYSNPKIAMYKICENIGCNTPFYVQRSNTIKKYCSESCKNASSQRRYRNKQKDFQ